MMLASEGPSALPLWINGHAFLTMTDDFQTVSNPVTGEALRLVPMCGAEELLLAIEASNIAIPSWASSTIDIRQAILETTASLLEKFSAHFTQILQEETGLDEAAATVEVNQACTALKTANPKLGSKYSLCAVINDASQPFATPVRLIAEILAAGQFVIIKPSVKAPSVLFAFAELTGRAGLPAGVLNLVQGDDKIISAIAESPLIIDITFAGQANIAEKIQAQMNLHQKNMVLA
ncbi:MAG: hypothetical protein RIR18_2153 [Pseudomonadota bacterium]|jgi:acyl-CoA reductase-like NAD-dependent aldehyde dehydrogenase